MKERKSTETKSAGGTLFPAALISIKIDAITRNGEIRLLWASIASKRNEKIDVDRSIEYKIKMYTCTYTHVCIRKYMYTPYI